MTEPKITEQKPMWFIGKTIRPPDNLDVFDTLQPMWNDPSLDNKTKALVYACSILSHRISVLESAMYQLKTKQTGQTGGAKKRTRRSSKKHTKSKK